MARRLERGDIFRFAPPDKELPVRILTRDSALEYLTRVTVAPITASIRDVPSEVRLGPDDGMKEPCVVNLHNVVTVHRDGLGRRLAQLGETRMGEVCAALGFAVGCGG